MTDQELQNLKCRIDNAERFRRQLGNLKDDCARLRGVVEAITGGCASLNPLTQDISRLADRLHGATGAQIAGLLLRHVESQIREMEEKLLKA